MTWIVQFPGVPEAVGCARKLVRDALHRLPQVDDAELIVSELVTNAILHSRSGAGGVLWVEIRRRRGVIRIAVTDEGAAGSEPSYRSTEEVDDFGRGLAIMAGLADNWGASSDVDDSQTVWAELASPAEVTPRIHTKKSSSRGV
ncbi:ATP-binding protein [Kitasatospora sp. MBT63]|uniref:ATP-binding protein n=1 Tax=Kitasatospora sp. MBT63 TaxID=1444768 RepID=UPI000689FC9F|nr:ATP-binding protein [Kitasatospora sp. MBT63]